MLEFYFSIFFNLNDDLFLLYRLRDFWYETQNKKNAKERGFSG
jgi:hypothetical protein